MSAFERYAPFVQDYIYRNGWENLRAIQVAAADVLFNTDENLLLTATHRLYRTIYIATAGRAYGRFRSRQPTLFSIPMRTFC